jgi:hypothetical protein
MSRNNPSTNTYLLLGLGLGTGAWVYSRLRVRKKLQDMLDGSESVQRAISEGLVAWDTKEMAVDKIGFVNAKSADVAFAEVLASLPEMPGSEENMIVKAGGQAKQIFEQATGVAIDPYLEEGTVGGRVIETMRSWWSEDEAKENPAMNWDQYLATLN